MRRISNGTAFSGRRLDRGSSWQPFHGERRPSRALEDHEPVGAGVGHEAYRAVGAARLREIDQEAPLAAVQGQADRAAGRRLPAPGRTRRR